MVEFKVPRQAIEDIDTPTTPSGAETHNPDGFMIPNHAINDLDRVAGELGDASELLADAEESAPTMEEDMPLEVAVSLEAARQNINFSFIDGETSYTGNFLSARQRRLALKLRNKLIEEFADEGVTEKTVGLLYAHTDDHQYYLAHLGKPLDNMPFIDLTRTRRSRRSSSSHSVSHRGHERPVVDLAVTPVYDPNQLSNYTDKSAAEWQSLLPDLDNTELWEAAGLRWGPWSPAVKV